MLKIVGDTINTYLDHWSRTPGVPIVHVIKEGNDVFVKQSPLLTPKCDDSGAMWIPIMYKTKVFTYFSLNLEIKFLSLTFVLNTNR